MIYNVYTGGYVYCDSPRYYIIRSMLVAYVPRIAYIFLFQSGTISGETVVYPVCTSYRARYGPGSPRAFFEEFIMGWLGG